MQAFPNKYTEQGDYDLEQGQNGRNRNLKQRASERKDRTRLMSVVVPHMKLVVNDNSVVEERLLVIPKTNFVVSKSTLFSETLRRKRESALENVQSMCVSELSSIAIRHKICLM